MRTTFAVVLVAVAVLFFSMIWEDEVVAGEGVPGIPMGGGGHLVTADIEIFNPFTGLWEEWNLGGCGGWCGMSGGGNACIHPDASGYFWYHCFDTGDGFRYMAWWAGSGNDGRPYDRHYAVTFLKDESGNPTGEVETCEYRVYTDGGEPPMSTTSVQSRAWRNKGQ